MKLIVISNPTNLNNEHEILCSLFLSGLEYFHLRKPDFSKEEMENFLKKISPNYFNKIVLHSHHGLVEKYNLKGKHISSNHIEFKSDSKYISTSFHTLEEIENCKEKYDYVFLSPIFDSISKAGYKSNFDLNELNHSPLLRRGAGGEVIALGGINKNTIYDAMKIGFDGVAVLGGLWMSNNPIETFNLLLNVCKEFNKAKDEQIA